MPLQMILGEIGPQRGVSPEVFQRLGLKGAHLADGQQVPPAVRCGRHELRKRMTDVARGAGAAADADEGMSEEFRQRGLAVRAGDGDDAATPEQRGAVEFSQTFGPGPAGPRKPGVIRHETRGKDHQRVPPRRVGGEFDALGIVDSPFRPKRREQRANALPAHAAAKDGNGFRKQRSQKIGRGRRH